MHYCKKLVKFPLPSKKIQHHETLCRTHYGDSYIVSGFPRLSTIFVCIIKIVVTNNFKNIQL